MTFTNSRINIVLTDSARKEKLKGTLKEVKDESKKAVHPKSPRRKAVLLIPQRTAVAQPGKMEPMI